jgi:hypothetical protein
MNPPHPLYRRRNRDAGADEAERFHYNLVDKNLTLGTRCT